MLAHDKSWKDLTPEDEEELGKEENLPPRLLARFKRQRERQLTVEVVLEHFRNWLYEQHGRTQNELRLKKNALGQLEAIVGAVGHLERASDLVRQYNELHLEVATLECEYTALESRQLTAFEYYDVDLTDGRTLLLFQRFMRDAEPEKWLIEGGKS